MKKFLHLTKRRPSLEQSAINRSGWPGADRVNGKSLRRVSTTSLTTQNIHIVRGAYNIDLNKVDASFTKLHKACLLNDDIRARKYIRKIDCNKQDNSKRSPLHLATVNGNYSLVRLLIEEKANVNIQDSEGKTPLIKSIECGHEQLIQHLLASGADPDISDAGSNTALHWAILTKSIPAISYIINSNRCNLKLKNIRGETCLHLAVRCLMFNTQIYDALIKRGADLTAKDNLGLTPLDIARGSENSVALKVLTAYFDKENASSGKTTPISLTHLDASTSLIEADLGEQSSEIKPLKPVNLAKFEAKPPHRTRMGERANRTPSACQSFSTDHQKLSSTTIHRTDKKHDEKSIASQNDNFLDNLKKLLDMPENDTFSNEIVTQSIPENRETDGSSTESTQVRRNDSDAGPRQPSKKLKKSPSDHRGSLVRRMSISAEDISQRKLGRNNHYNRRNTEEDSAAAEDLQDEPIRASKSFNGFDPSRLDLVNQDNQNGHVEEESFGIGRSSHACSLSHRTLLETQRMCDEFRKKFNEKNRDNLELEKKVIRMESQSNHLNLDISSIEEHNKILESELEKVRKLQEIDRKELGLLKIEVEKLSHRNNALAEERQKLVSDLMNLRVSASTDEVTNRNDKKADEMRKDMLAPSGSNPKHIYIKATIDDIEDLEVKENDACENPGAMKLLNSGTRKEDLSFSLSCNETTTPHIVLPNIRHKLSDLNALVEVMAIHLDKGLCKGMDVNIKESNIVSRHFEKIRSTVADLSKQINLISTYSFAKIINNNEDSDFSLKDCETAPTTEPKITVRDFHATRGKLQEQINKLKYDLRSGS